MPHALADLEAAGDVLTLHGLIQLLGVGEQDLVVPRLDQSGGEAGQVAEQGGQVGDLSGVSMGSISARWA